MNIGEAAAATGVTPRMIRHYEKIGLIVPADRTEAGYRVYDTDDIHTLRFVRRARNLGFSISDIQELLALWRNRERASADVRTVTEGHLQSLRRKFDEIQGMIVALEQLLETCSDDDRPDCPILRDLGDPGELGAAGTAEHRFGVGRVGRSA